MAVESHRLHAAGAAAHHHWQPQANRAGDAAAAAAATIDAPLFLPSSTHACYGEEVFAGGAVQGQGYQSSSYVGGLVETAPAATAGRDRYSQLLSTLQAQRGADGTASQQLVTNKRKRDDHSPALEAASFASQAYQQRMEIDSVVLNHAAKMWTGLVERTRRHTRLIAAAVEAKAAKRLRDKDEEIEKLTRMNWALQERVRTVCVEAQVWRDVARSNEAAASILRCDLEYALNAQASRHGGVGDGSGAADDAESCCCGENEVHVLCGEEEVGTTVLERQSTAADDRTCKACGESPAVVLLLPCRHLCACASCADAVPACPACGCAKNGSVCINFS